MCIPSPDAVMDLTMRSNGSNSSQHFALSCITGERNTDGLELSIKKDNSIMRMTNTPRFTVQKPCSKEVLASGFSGMEHRGIFYCHLNQGSNHQTTVTLISNYNKCKCLHRFVGFFVSLAKSPKEEVTSIHIVYFFQGLLRPQKLSILANKGDTVHLAMEIVGMEERDVTWKFNGKGFVIADVLQFSRQCKLAFML